MMTGRIRDHLTVGGELGVHNHRVKRDRDVPPHANPIGRGMWDEAYFPTRAEMPDIRRLNQLPMQRL
jgi:hypothetical protein